MMMIARNVIVAALLLAVGASAQIIQGGASDPTQTLVEDLRTGCPLGQTGVSDGAGGLACTAAGGSAILDLFYMQAQFGNSGGFQTLYYPAGCFPSNVALTTNTNVNGAVILFDDLDAEVLYCVGPLLRSDANLTHINFEILGKLGASTANGLTMTVLASVSCIAVGETTSTGFTALTYSTPSNVSATIPATPSQTLMTLTAADVNISASCSAGELPIWKFEADETSGQDAMFGMFAARVWTD